MADLSGGEKVMIRLAGEDFEDQPLPISSTVRGPCMLYDDSRITEEESHGGKKSMEVKAIARDKGIGKYDFFLGTPQINLESNAHYRITAWAKAVGGDTEAFIMADQYDNSPHDDGPRMVRQRTNSAKAGDGWKPITLDFTTAAMAPQIDLRFAALGPGQAYFDDFAITKLGDGLTTAR